MIITGASGHVGCHLAKRVEYAQITVTAGENKPPGRIVEYNNLPAADVLVHLAANADTTSTDRDSMMRVNHVEPLAMFRRAIDQGCRKIIYASSCAVYGDGPTPFREDQALRPLNVYAESKARLDDDAMRLAEQTGCKVYGLRLSNVFGPSERHKGNAASMVYRIGQQMLNGNAKLFRDGEQKRDWVSVEDVVDAILLFRFWRCASGVYNIGSGRSESFKSIVRYWNRAMGTKRRIEWIDNPYTRQYQSVTEVDISKARRIGYRPLTDLRTDILHMVDAVSH